MANTLNLGNGNWATKKDSLLAYNSENGNFKPLPFSFTRATSATVINKDGLIETVGSGEPRIDYKDDSKGALLLEPSRSNLITYSEDFSQGWSSNGGGVTINQTISPDGTLNADKLFAQTNNGQHRVDFSSSNASGATTFSFFAKSAEYNSVWARIGLSTVYFNLENGEFYDETSATTSSMKYYGNGWYRCIITKEVSSANEVCRINLTQSYKDSSVWIGDGTSGLYVWAAMHEVGSYATSYIPTQGSVVTRVADSCVQTPPDGIINSIEGVLYAEIKKDKGSQFSLVSLDKSSDSANYIYVGYLNNTTSLRAQIKIDSVTVLDEDINIGDTNVFSKVAVKYKSGDYAFFINGSKVGNTSTSTDSFSNEDLDRLEFGYSLNSSFKYYGNVRELKLYNTALTDAELINLTTI